MLIEEKVDRKGKVIQKKWGNKERKKELGCQFIFYKPEL